MLTLWNTSVFSWCLKLRECQWQGVAGCRSCSGETMATVSKRFSRHDDEIAVNSRDADVESLRLICTCLSGTLEYGCAASWLDTQFSQHSVRLSAVHSGRLASNHGWDWVCGQSRCAAVSNTTLKLPSHILHWSRHYGRWCSSNSSCSSFDISFFL